MDTNSPANEARVNTAAPGPPDGGHAVRYFGAFALLGEAGSGGMGVVYFARQLDLNRKAAVKFISAARPATPLTSQRFRQEAEALARLDHPNIVHIYDVGVVEEQPYIAMKWAEGGTLAQRLLDTAAATPPSRSEVDAALRLVLQVARAVQHAHERGVLHRDLKPANILLDEDGTPLVADFGLAQLVDETGETSLLAGTPHYLAPEQAAGNTPASEATDLFSLGVVLYELITGSRPFDGPNRQAVLQAVQQATPARPSFLNPAVDLDLEAICLACLAQDPACRYPSAAALAEDLHHWLRHEPVSVRPGSRWDRARKWSRRNSVTASLLGLLLVVALVSLAAIAWQGQRAAVLQARSRQDRARLAATETRARQGEAEAKFSAGRGRDGVAILTGLLRQRPDDVEVAARLFSALSLLQAAWPALPALRHGGEVRYGAITADQQYIVTAADDGWVRLWVATNGVCLGRFPHETQRGRFALSPNGEWLATLATNGGAAVWHLESQQPVLQLSNPPPASIRALDFSPDGELLAAGFADGKFETWSLPTRARLASADHGEPLRWVGFNPGGGQLLTVGDTAGKLWAVFADAHDLPAPEFSVRPAARPLGAQFNAAGDRFLTWNSRQVELWDAQSPGPATVFDLNHELSAATFDPTGRRVALGTTAGQVFLQVGTNRFSRISRSAETDGRLNAVRFTPNNDFVLTASAEGRAHVILRRTNTRFLEPITSSHAFHDVIPSPDGARVLTLGADHTARYWSIARAYNATFLWPVMPRVRRVALSPDGQLAATVREDDTIALISTTSMSTRGVTPASPARLTCVAFSESGPWLAAADQAGNLFLHDARNAVPRLGPLPHAAAITRLVWANRAPVLACVSTQGVTVWNFAGLLATNHSPDAAVGAAMLWQREVADLRAFAVAPDGLCLVLAEGRAGVQIVELNSSRPASPRRLELAGEVNQVCFSPAGRQIATATGNEGRVWDAATGQSLSPPLRSPTVITCLAFSPDAGTVLLGAMDGRLSLWNARSGAASGELPRHRTRILSADFSPDGRWVASSGADDCVRLASVATGLPVIHYVPVPRALGVRYHPSGSRLHVTTEYHSATLVDSPVTAKPPTDLLFALAETFLNQKLDPQGEWRDLTAEEFLHHRQQLSAIKSRLGPPPQVRIYH